MSKSASTAEWIIALGTLVTLAASVFVLLRDQLDRRKSQARSVNAWAVEVTNLRLRDEYGADTSQMGGQSVRIAVLNASSEPVYDFIAWVKLSYDPKSGYMGGQERHVLPPGESELWVDGVRLPKGGLAGLPHVDITFRDVRDKLWWRRHYGRLGADGLVLACGSGETGHSPSEAARPARVGAATPTWRLTANARKAEPRDGRRYSASR